MANSPDIFVARKILSSEYKPYASGKIFRAPRSQPNFPISGWALNNDFTGWARFDELVKSARLVMPDLIRHPECIGTTGFRHSPE